MSRTTMLWLSGMMIALLIIAIIIGNSIRLNRLQVGNVVAMGDTPTQAAILSCSADGLPVMEIALADDIADYGESVRVIVADQMVLFEARASGVIGAVLTPDILRRLKQSVDAIFITIIDWSGRVKEMRLHGRLADWLDRLPCVGGGGEIHGGSVGGHTGAGRGNRGRV